MHTRDTHYTHAPYTRTQVDSGAKEEGEEEGKRESPCRGRERREGERDQGG
jgi:hypothetical protein